MLSVTHQCTFLSVSAQSLRQRPESAYAKNRIMLELEQHWHIDCKFYCTCSEVSEQDGARSPQCVKKKSSAPSYCTHVQLLQYCRKCFSEIHILTRVTPSTSLISRPSFSHTHSPLVFRRDSSCPSNLAAVMMTAQARSAQ